jgi:hypothetical protein
MPPPAGTAIVSEETRRQLPFEGFGISILPNLSPVARDYPEVLVFENWRRCRSLAYRFSLT